MNGPLIYKALYKAGGSTLAFTPSGDSKTFYEEMDAYRFKFGFSKTRGLVASMVRESLDRAEEARTTQADFAEPALMGDDSEILWRTYKSACDEEHAMSGAVRALLHVLEFMDYVTSMYIHSDNRPAPEEQE